MSYKAPAIPMPRRARTCLPPARDVWLEDMTGTQTHWDQTYAAKAETQVSWFQASPERSLALIRSAAPSHSASIIDVGGGASSLVDSLLADGYTDLTVLDVSEVALGRSKARLGERASNVAWIVADVTNWQPPKKWNVWHDRAVFHFLTETAAQDAYITALKQGTAPGCTVLIATFALNGPERCSGLPVCRYSPATLASRLGDGFVLYAESAETHSTPFGTTQEFSYAGFLRR
jgi:2-polyprenyl-3-methyl-5-hydroxy-6-metoxy-1,4-benzoquinol methylase